MVSDFEPSVQSSRLKVLEFEPPGRSFAVQIGNILRNRGNHKNDASNLMTLNSCTKFLHKTVRITRRIFRNHTKKQTKARNTPRP